MEEENFEFDLVLSICNNDSSKNNMVSNFLKLFIERESEKKDNKILFNVVVSYMKGNFDESHTKSFMKGICEINKNDLEKFIFELDKYVDEECLKIMLNKSSELKKTLKIKNTKIIWSMPTFRKELQKYKKLKKANDYILEGIFKNIFSLEEINTDIFDYINCYDDIINDGNASIELIEIIHNFILIYENSGMSTKTRCDYNLFILLLLFKLSVKYGDVKKNEIRSGFNIEEISEMNIRKKIFATKVLYIKNILRNILETYDCYSQMIGSKITEIMKKICFGKQIQKIFVKYWKNYENIVNGDIIENCADYYNFLFSYDVDLSSNTKRKYGKTKIEYDKNYLNFVSEILGGLDGKIKNYNTRILVFNTICNTYEKTGFKYYNNLHNNLFKYISEVDYEKSGDFYIIGRIKHQKKETQILYQILDNIESLDDKSKHIFSETIYRLIDKSYEYFDMFNQELANKIKNYSEMTYYESGYLEVLETAQYTLLLYDNLYEKKIIEYEKYPELEEKIILYVGRILKNMNTNNVFSIKKYTAYAKNLLELCSKFLIFRKNLMHIIVEVKDEITNGLKNHNFNEKDKFMDLLINYEDDTDKYPEELLDPLTCKKINIPIMIPNSGEIFERTSIISHVYKSKNNPYTREELTLEMLSKYNEKEEVREKLMEFIKKKSNFLEN